MNDAPHDMPIFMLAQLEHTAMVLYETEQFDRAAEHLRMMVQMCPHKGDYWSLLGVTYRRQNLKAAALKALQRAIELDAGDKNALINLGETLCEVGKVREGVELLRGVFDMAYEPGLAPEEQDYFTRRAGMQLAVIQEVINGFIITKSQ
ncbi:MAG: hypothetical protein H0U74_19385 [Bradymonadaceae bacterium]|nr:hypothetical protein [Lujinxingiaceae bacterium]